MRLFGISKVYDMHEFLRMVATLVMLSILLCVFVVNEASSCLICLGSGRKSRCFPIHLCARSSGICKVYDMREFVRRVANIITVNIRSCVFTASEVSSCSICLGSGRKSR